MTAHDFIPAIQKTIDSMDWGDFPHRPTIMKEDMSLGAGQYLHVTLETTFHEYEIYEHVSKFDSQSAIEKMIWAGIDGAEGAAADCASEDEAERMYFSAGD